VKDEDGDLAIVKLKKYNLQGSYQIPAELIQAGSDTFWSQIHTLINFLISGRSLIIAPIYKKGDKNQL
jgi:hypothetical protein